AEADRVSHTDLVQSVLDESGYTAMWQADRSPDAPGRLENLKELVVAMAEFENLTGFLEHVSLVMDNAADNSGAMVNLMTLQSARVPLRGQEVPKAGGFSVGDRVFHQKFGYGTVRKVEDNRLEINFEHAGDKKVMDAFVQRA